MKIYFFTKSYYPTIGGVENSIFYLSKNFINQKIEIEIISFDGENDNEITSLNEGLVLKRFFFKKSKFPNLSYNNLLNKTKSVVNTQLNIDKHAYIITRNSPIALGLIQCNYKVVHIFPTISKLNVEGLYRSNKLIFRLLKIIDFYSLFSIEKKIISHPNSSLVVFSELMKINILKEYKTKKHIEVIYPGVDFEVFKPELDCQLDNNFNKKYILYVGRLSKAKNLEFLLNSFKLVNEDYNLYIVGEGPEKEKLKDLAINLGISDKVFFLGKQVEKLAYLYSNAQLTVLPSKIETFGQVLIESLACGTPVLAFGNSPQFITASTEIISEKFNGEVVSKDSTFEFASAISRLLVKEKETENNILYCKNKFNWKLTSNKIFKLFNE